jgi:hypothetical protein
VRFASGARRVILRHGLLDQHCGLMSVEEKAAAIVEGIGDDAQIELN